MKIDIDMREVARLTRAGKLADAMRLLGGGEAPAPGWTRLVGDGAPASGRLARAKRAFTNLTHTVVARAPLEGVGLRRAEAPPLPEGAQWLSRSFADAAGARDYRVYVPAGHAGEALPLVMMLHGCTQDAEDFAAGTRMNEVAQALGFLVVYPTQPPSANMQKCWNWFDAAQQRRESGEPALLASLARTATAEFGADPARVYVAGLSAGGAAAAILASTYPDVFAAAGVHSGLACGAARDMASAFAAMGAGAGGAPRRGAPVPTIVFHGDADRTVNPLNADHVLAQSLPARGYAERSVHGVTAAGMGFTRTVYEDASGRALAESWRVEGAGHAWSGGGALGSYTEPRGPDASREMARFFLAHRLQRA